MKKFYLVLCSSFVLASTTVFAKTENEQSASLIESTKALSYLQQLVEIEESLEKIFNNEKYSETEQKQITSQWSKWDGFCRKGILLGASIPQIVTNLENAQKQQKINLSGTIKHLKNGFHQSAACILSLTSLVDSESKEQQIINALPRACPHLALHQINIQAM